jgi:peptidoglycan/LPS O-acetylase OafA/YrhL
MSDEIAYSPPPRRELPEAPKNFGILLIGVMLCIVGALLINQGINAAKDVGLPIVLSMALLAAGAMLIITGASKAWPRNPEMNIALAIIGALCLVGSGAIIAGDLGKAAYATVLTLIGIALIVAGVKVAAQAWKRFHR